MRKIVLMDEDDNMMATDCIDSGYTTNSIINSELDKDSYEELAKKTI